MDESLTLLPAISVRALIAERYVGPKTGTVRVGSVDLRTHQVDAVARIREILRHRRCALLADEVGLGKTYVAATIATEASHTLLLAPAGLCAMWREALFDAGAHAVDVVAHETMSRKPRLDTDYDLVIVDEAHHFRNPATRRYTSLANVIDVVPVLFLSATPVHNSERDLRALFALALGSRAWHMELGELLHSIVRRQHHSIGSDAMPVADAPVWLTLPDSDCILERILRLPPSLPPADGGDADALVIHGLCRQWASSDHALARALSRRRAIALALISALEQGRYPSRSELRSWTHAEDSLQLGFPELLASPHADAAALLPIVRAHDGAVAELSQAVRDHNDTDRARAEHLRILRARHPGARIVAFTQFADTVTGLYRLLAGSGRVAMLTARGAITAGGPMSRREVLHRFSPSTARGNSVAAAEEIDLLLTTDMLSEGVDLPDISIVVHLDLPWTPARLEQRVGRALRLTSRHRRVAVYCMSPPASATALVRSEQILRTKLKAAARSVGIAGTILPATVETPRSDHAPPSESREAIRALVAKWRDEGAPDASDTLVVGAVQSSLRGWVALVEHGPVETALIIARDGTVLGADDERLAVVRAACGPDIPVSSAVVDDALRELGEWVLHRKGFENSAIPIAPGSRAFIRILRRIGTITARAPAHRRSVITELAIHARRTVLEPRGIARERGLAVLADAPMADEAWLRAVGLFGKAELNDHEPLFAPRNSRVVALLLLREA